jgi:hypothetical protein
MDTMTPEERFSRIENALEALIGTQAEHAAQIDKHNAAIRDLILVGRTALSSIELQGAQKHTDEKLNILIDTVDRIIRGRNGNPE